MKEVITFLFICSVTSASIAEIPILRGPPGEPLRGDRHRFSVKGRQAYQRSLQPSPEYKEDREQCDPRADYVESTIKLHTKVALLGDSKLFVSDDDKEFNKYCRQAPEIMEELNNQLQCMQGMKKTHFSWLEEGWNLAIKKRCKSKSWRKEYLKHSRCINDHNVQKRFEKCRDREDAAMKYIFQNISREGQLNVVCCFLPFTYDCVEKTTKAVCGQETADFMIDSLYLQRQIWINGHCRGMYEEHCVADYPQALEDFDKIYHSSAPPHGNVYNRFYALLRNRLNTDRV